ncbi:FecR family protein [Chitinophaga flava]|uniref:FecR protein domain-containing protein n=1 Tax=Chitinophaga flava TaxID=2259036 RepID=A0A365XT08_9BACT|nr:FecR domain-containing protein [Chitinophaga flava]RBL89507.1 hypothetical protein DF182_23630 [Chitinophaga flava]
MEPNYPMLKDMLDRLFEGEASEQEKEMFRQWIISVDMSDADTAVAAETLQAAKQEMFYRIVEMPRNTKPETRVRKMLKTLTMWKAAAAIIPLAFLSWFLLNRMGKSRQQQEIHYTTIAVTEKNVKHITLPDGSEVWLNARSRLEYAQDRFSKDVRCVRLTGEGYFEIVKDDTRPFVVASENIETQVLGTGFNIETYPGETEIRVALVHGAVSVKDIHTNTHTLLHPMEMLRYSKGSRKWGVAPFSSNKVHNWVQGHLIFEELPLTDVLDRLAYKYGLSLQYDRELVKHKSVTGDFAPDKWQTVLDNILFIHKLKYITKNGTVYISKR